jgi:hypothetical protein
MAILSDQDRTDVEELLGFIVEAVLDEMGDSNNDEDMYRPFRNFIVTAADTLDKFVAMHGTDSAVGIDRLRDRTEKRWTSVSTD